MFRKKTRKENDKINIKKQLGEKNLIIPRYTYEVWRTFYPTANYDMWELNTHPNNIISFLENTIKTLIPTFEEIGNIKYEILTLNHRYLNWLKEKKIEDNPENQCEYLSILSEEDKLNIMKEEHMNEFHQVYFLQVITSVNPVDNETSFHLTEELSEELANYFNEIFTDFNIFVPGYVVDFETAMEYEDRLLNLSKAFLEDHIRAKLHILDTQKYKSGVNFSMLFIPIIFKKTYEKAVFSYSDIIGEAGKEYLTHPEMIVFTKEYLKKNGFSTIEAFLDTNTSKKIHDIFSENAHIVPFLQTIDRIVESAKVFMKILKEKS